MPAADAISYAMIPMTLDIPDYFNFGFDVVDMAARRERNKLAMIWAGQGGECRKITFWEMSVESNKVANVLRSIGIKSRDNVLVMLPAIPELYVASLGVIKRGAVLAPSEISLSAGDLQHRCNKASIKAVITDTANAPKLEEIRAMIPTVEHFIVIDGNREGWIDLRAETDAAPRTLLHFGFDEMTRADDPILLYVTRAASPKIIMHRHSYALAHRVTAQLWLDLKPTDLHWTIADAGSSHMAWGALFGGWLIGATIFVHEDEGALASRDILHLLASHGVTTLCAPAATYRTLIREEMRSHDLGELRHCTSFDGPLHAGEINAWKDGTSVEIYEGYAPAETVAIVAALRGMPLKYGSIGKPLPPFEVEILTGDLLPAAPGVEGEIAVKIWPDRPPGIFNGYIGDEATNGEVFRGDWWLTGDRGYRDGEGSVWGVGKK